MPIIINELVVKATVDAAAPAAGAGNSASAAASRPAAEDREALVTAIVEEVLRVLDRMKER